MPPPRIAFAAFLSRLRKSSTQPAYIRALTTTAKIFLVAHLTVEYLFAICPSNGISMMPTIPHHYRGTPLLLESRLYRRGRGIRVGDIITFVHPVNPTSAHGCKRVIGMPGDYVSVMTPNREDEDVGKGAEEGEWTQVRDEVIQVPEGHCWVAGDNLDWSRDSRVFGAVPLGLVRGKVLGVMWPWTERKWFGNKSGLQDVSETEHEWIAK